MTIIAAIPIFVALAGLGIYLASANGKPMRVGEIMFFCGLLATMFALAGHVIRLGGSL